MQQVKLLTIRVNLEAFISQLETASHKYVRTHEAWLHRRENLEMGKLTENLLPPSVLREILNSAELNGAYILDPIEWYYEHIVIIPLWLDNRLIYRTKLPVVSAQTWQYIQLYKWPAPVKDYELTLMVPDSVLRDTETGQLDISPTCYGERPRVCRRGLLNPANLYPCITRLLDKAPTYDPQCAVTLQHRFSHDIVHHYDDDTYILQTGGTELTVRCSGQAEQRTVVAPGVYEINLRYPCSLHGNSWILTSVFQRTSNYTLEPIVTDFVFNISLTGMMDEILELNPAQFDLDALSPVDRRQIQVEDIFLSRPGKSNKKMFVWHSFWSLTSVGLAVAAAVYGRRRYLQRKSAKPANEIELQVVESVAAPAAAVASDPVNTKVFQFTAPKFDYV